MCINTASHVDFWCIIFADTIILLNGRKDSSVQLHVQCFVCVEVLRPFNNVCCIKNSKYEIYFVFLFFFFNFFFFLISSFKHLTSLLFWNLELPSSGNLYRPVWFQINHEPRKI